MAKAREAAMDNSAEGEGEEEDDDKVRRTPWQERLLTFTDSLFWMACIMTVVFVAIAVAAYQFIADVESVTFTSKFPFLKI
jgi:hypothetical protein